jgi:hypothetical protein
MLVVGLVVVVALPWWVYPPVAMDILAWGLFAISVDLLLGFTGLLSFGHAAFWGASAYATGLVAIHSGLPFPVAIVAGAVVAMLLAVPTGYLAVRRTGIYFAMVTLAFAQMLYFLANQWRAVTGGEDGLQGIPKSFFGLTGVETDPFYFYYAAAPIVLIGIAIACVVLALSLSARRLRMVVWLAFGAIIALLLGRAFVRLVLEGVTGTVAEQGVSGIAGVVRSSVDSLMWFSFLLIVVALIVAGLAIFAERRAEIAAVTSSPASIREWLRLHARDLGWIGIGIVAFVALWNIGGADVTLLAAAVVGIILIAVGVLARRGGDEARPADTPA